MFRSLRCYRIHSAWPSDEAALSRKLEAEAFKPCSAYAEQSFGFEPPLAQAGDSLARRLAGADLLQLRLQSRVLPQAAVKEALVDRVAAFSQRMLREPSRREVRELKEEVYGELLPQALLKSDRLQAFYLLEERVLAVATPTAKAAELFLETLRDAFGSLEATPLVYKRPVTRLLTDVFLSERKGKFHIGRECRMKDASEPRASVTWTEVELADPSVRKHVKDGLKVDRLAMSFDEIMSFTLDEELVTRKLKFVGLEAVDDEMDDEDPLAWHDAEFAVAVSGVRRMLDGLSGALGGYDD